MLAQRKLPPTVIVSGEASITETVEALKLGVHDFIEKPFSRERLLQSIRNALENASLRREVAALRSELGVGAELIGDSPAMHKLHDLILRAARTDARILVRGESGSGKELVASALHRQSSRAEGPFVKINCAAIPEHLIEDELFGHAKGAFTDARAAKPGLFEEAHGGTLFLDEIGDMSYPLQARLLRVLEDGRVRRLGDTRDREVDVRVIAATHQDLEKNVKEGRFREDLYFRLAALPLEIPPLRDRGEDISGLFDHFVEHFAKAPPPAQPPGRARGLPAACCATAGPATCASCATCARGWWSSAASCSRSTTCPRTSSSTSPPRSPKPAWSSCARPCRCCRCASSASSAKRNTSKRC